MERAAPGPARAGERADLAAGPAGRGQRQQPGAPVGGRRLRQRRRRVAAARAAGLREGEPGLLHQRPPAGSLRRASCAASPTPTPPTAWSAGPGAEVTLGGVVCEFQERMAKSGSGKYAFFKLEDQYGQVEFMVGNNAADRIPRRPDQRRAAAGHRHGRRPLRRGRDGARARALLVGPAAGLGAGRAQFDDGHPPERRPAAPRTRSAAWRGCCASSRAPAARSCTWKSPSEARRSSSCPRNIGCWPATSCWPGSSSFSVIESRFCGKRARDGKPLP